MDWVEKVIASAAVPDPDLPGFPADTVQHRTVGAAGADALKEIAPFYRLIASNANLTNARVLDFGVGWGRILRFFVNETSRLHGVDVDADLLDECRRTKVPGEFLLVSSAGQLPYPAGSMDVAYAYSVFSHLPPALADDRIAELARVLRQGGVLVVTTQTARFVDLCVACKAKPDPNVFEQMYGNVFTDPARSLADYRQGKAVYGASGGGVAVLGADVYGWAAIPPEHVAARWGAFEVVEFIDDPGRFNQGVFVLRKR